MKSPSDLPAEPVRGSAPVQVSSTPAVDSLSECELNEALLNAVLDALPVGVIIADAKGGILRHNAASLEMWGVPPLTTTWEGYCDWVAYLPATGKRLTAEEWAMSRTLRTDEVVRGELVRCQNFRTGERRYFLTNSTPVRDHAGRIVAGVVAELDVTALRNTKQELRRSEERLRDRSADLERQIEERTNEAKGALSKLFEEQKIECIGRFAGTVVHDFNNNLTAIIANLNVIRRQLQQRAPDLSIDAAIRSAEQGAMLASRLLSFARRQGSRPERLSVAEVLEEMSELLRRSFEPRIIFSLATAPDLPPVFVERSHLELSLLNISANSREEALSP